MGPPASHGVTRVPWYSGYCLVSELFAYGTFTRFGETFQPSSAKSFESIMQSATPEALLPLVWPLSLSLAATQKIDVSFSSSAYLDVSVQRVPFVWLCIHHTMTAYCTAGFPHSEICGSIAICASPQLIAACHVLLRLLMPRHPPCALVHLTLFFSVLLLLFLFWKII